ncbi:MAG: hypothetical protein HY916_03500 [Desulfovibrio sp.]|jgi:hypothetical protein|nr:hypothetical protein [Desulfovibrio sp.]
MSPAASEHARTGLHPLLALCALALCVVGLDLLLGPYTLVRFHDAFDNAFFHEYFQAREILANGLSFWTDKLGGLPSFAGLYPPYGPLALYSLALPPWLLGTVIDATALALSGYGMYRLLADFLGADKRAALLAAIPFALTGYSYQSLTFFNFFPLFFMFAADVSGPGTWRFRLPRLLGMALLVHGSMPVVTLPVYSVLHLLLVLAFDRSPWRSRRIAAAFLVWTGYALFFAPTLVSLLLYAPLSNRILTAPATGLAAVLAGLKSTYGYSLSICLPLSAALYFAFDARTSGDVRKALLLCLGLAGAILLSSDAAKPLFGNTPLKYVDFYHYSGALMVALPMLAGLGASHLLRGGGAVSWKRALVALTLTAPLVSTDNLLLKACMLLFLLGGVAAIQMAQPGAQQGAGGGSRRRLALAAGLCGLGLAAGVAQMQTLLMMDHSFVPYAKGFGHHRTLSDLARAAAREPFRVASVNLSPAVAKSHGLDTADLLTQIYSRQYRDYLEAVVGPQLDTPEKRRLFPEWAYREAFLVKITDTLTTRRFLVYNKNAPTRADMWNLPLLCAMNVRYLLSPRPVEGLADGPDAPAELEAVDNGPGAPLAALVGTRVDGALRLPVYVYRLRHSFPRGWLTAGGQVLPGEGEVRAALEYETVASLASRALLAEADAAALPAALRLPPAAPAQGTAEPEALPLTSRSDGRYEWAGSIAAPRLLVVASNYHPGWRATVNGQSAPVLRANHAFMAVPLPQAGPVRVRLEFTDPVTVKAHALTLAGLLLIFACGLLGTPPSGTSSGSPSGTTGNSGSPPQATYPGATAAPTVQRDAVRLASDLVWRRALAWGVAGVLVAGLLFALLRAVKEPADSQRLVWFILVKATVCGLLTAPLAASLLRWLVACDDPASASKGGPA